MTVLTRFLPTLDEAQGGSPRKAPPKGFFQKQRYKASRLFRHAKRVAGSTKTLRGLRKELVQAGMGAGGKTVITKRTSTAAHARVNELMRRVANAQNRRVVSGVVLARAARKAALITAAAGVAGKTSLMTYAALKNKAKRPKYDVYPEHGYSVSNVDPYKPRYMEPQFNVYESIAQDLITRNK